MICKQALLSCHEPNGDKLKKKQFKKSHQLINLKFIFYEIFNSTTVKIKFKITLLAISKL